MFALSFRFLSGRYHATPWGRNVNEADVAWPPDPWRLLRALIAVWWRKGDHERWSQDDLATLIDTLAEVLPEYSLPTGAIHAHTRHYMPSPVKKKLVVDAFVHLPVDSTLVVTWRDVTLDHRLFAFAAGLANAVGYLGRAESWTECEAVADWNGAVNCRPLGKGISGGDRVRLLAPLTQSAYTAERERIMSEMTCQVLANAKTKPTQRRLVGKLNSQLRSKDRKAHTLPERLIDAMSLDTADYQDRGWSRPPAARIVVYERELNTLPSVVSRRFDRRLSSRNQQGRPTVARFLLAGRPLPRVEDTVKLGELMRRAALSMFGWQKDEAHRWIAKAPSAISGRDADGKPLRHPTHGHAFWLPEDADGDGWIDHISVYIADGITSHVRAKLDRITRLWLAPTQRQESKEPESGSVREWRLALEGFGRPADFSSSARIFATARQWRSATPFLSAGHLKASGYAGEVRRLLRRRGLEGAKVLAVQVLPTINIGGTDRRAIHFHRFRSRGREAQPDKAGALLRISLQTPIDGPLSIGYGSHFGLGMFLPESAGHTSREGSLMEYGC